MAMTAAQCIFAQLSSPLCYNFCNESNCWPTSCHVCFVSILFHLATKQI